MIVALPAGRASFEEYSIFTKLSNDVHWCLVNRPLLRSTEDRWHLYRLLAEPARVRLLALVAEAELTVGELATLLDELKPNVSRHATALRQGGLILERRQGTRAFLRLSPSVTDDVVVMDALTVGRRLCAEEGRLGRISEVLHARDGWNKSIRDAAAIVEEPHEVARATPAYVFGLKRVLLGLELAVYVATGDDDLLDVLAPLYQRVIVFDGSTQDGNASGVGFESFRRTESRGYENVVLAGCLLDVERNTINLGIGACAVFGCGVLSKAVMPADTLRILCSLLRPAGTLVLFESELEWNAYGEPLRGWAKRSGLDVPNVTSIPEGYVRNQAEDGSPPWWLISARRASEASSE